MKADIIPLIISAALLVIALIVVLTGHSVQKLLVTKVKTNRRAFVGLYAFRNAARFYNMYGCPNAVFVSIE
jgi:hypothetical protein